VSNNDESESSSWRIACLGIRVEESRRTFLKNVLEERLFSRYCHLSGVLLCNVLCYFTTVPRYGRFLFVIVSMMLYMEDRLACQLPLS
jgi:hypothetical protein